MKAVILCAGLGTRLRPLTYSVPKVMVEIGGKPLLQHHIEWLVKNGIKDIGINLFHLAHKVTDYIGDGSKFGARIHYIAQNQLQGTASDFKAFESFVGNEQTLVIYGDNMFDLALNDFVTFHNARKGIATIALKHWKDPTSKGIVGQDDSGKILWFKEKPKKEEVTTDLGNAGIYIVEPEIFSYIEKEKNQDFGIDTFPALISQRKNVFGFELTCYHIDIGTPEALEKARADHTS